MACPQCGSSGKHPALAKEIKDLLKLKADVMRQVSLRMVHEGLDKCAAVTDKNSKWYGKAIEYAAEKLCYYQCFKCGKPYFGGFQNCENLAEDEDDNANKFNPADLICGACVPNQDLKSCPTHGTEFIEYKCKFCCNVAQWFCWGTTHFCTACHKLQERGEYVTKKKKEDLPKCEGRKKCPLKVEHPPNGTAEFALGCAICRHNSKGF
jgi:E3 ubiquitin-protein ligase MYCBP2